MGHLGKEKMQKKGLSSYGWRFQAVAALVVAPLAGLLGCSAGQSATYVGTLTAVSGTCDALNRATLVIHGTTVQFLPQDGVLALDGTATDGGVIAADQAAPGMDRRPYHLVLNAQRQAEVVTGTYLTPRCRYTLALHKTHD